MTTKRVAEINAQIAQLIAERVALLNQEAFENEESIKDLKWVKGCVGKLEICDLNAAGLPKYKIHVFGMVVPHLTQPICVFGTSKHYENNIMLGDDFLTTGTCFYTSSAETMCAFLRHVEFQELTFNEKDFQVMEAVKATQG